MSDPQPTPIFAISATADGVVTHATKPAEKEDQS